MRQITITPHIISIGDDAAHESSKFYNALKKLIVDENILGIKPIYGIDIPQQLCIRSSDQIASEIERIVTPLKQPHTYEITSDIDAECRTLWDAWVSMDTLDRSFGMVFYISEIDTDDILGQPISFCAYLQYCVLDNLHIRFEKGNFVETLRFNFKFNEFSMDPSYFYGDDLIYLKDRDVSPNTLFDNCPRFKCIDDPNMYYPYKKYPHQYLLYKIDNTRLTDITPDIKKVTFFDNGVCVDGDGVDEISEGYILIGYRVENKHDLIIDDAFYIVLDGKVPCIITRDKMPSQHRTLLFCFEDVLRDLFTHLYVENKLSRTFLVYQNGSMVPKVDAHLIPTFPSE